MLIFRLLVLIIFFPLTGMIVQKDNYDIILKMCDGSLPITQEEARKLYIADVPQEVILNQEKTIIDLTGKRFYNEQKELTVGNVSRAINYLMGRLNPSDLSIKKQCKLFTCIDLLVSDSCFEKIYPLGNLLAIPVKYGLVDSVIQNLFWSLSKRTAVSEDQKVKCVHNLQDFSFNGKLLHNVLVLSFLKNEKAFTFNTLDLGSFPFKSSTVITLNGLPNLFIEQSGVNLISAIIQNSPFLKQLNVHDTYMPVLSKEALTDPTPPHGCYINLDHNNIKEIEKGAVRWWNQGTLSLKGNPLTPESIKILSADVCAVPLLQSIVNTTAMSLKRFNYQDRPEFILYMLVGTLVSMATTLPTVNQWSNEYTGFALDDRNLGAGYAIGAYVLGAFMLYWFEYLIKPENAYLSEKKYLPLTLILDRPSLDIKKEKN